VIDGTVGASRLMLMRANDVVGTAVELLRADTLALLCERGCEVCDEARAIAQAALAKPQASKSEA
jgi:hypothetical protein